MCVLGCRVSLSRAGCFHIQRTDGGCFHSLAGREENPSRAFLQCFFSEKLRKKPLFKENPSNMLGFSERTILSSYRSRSPRTMKSKKNLTRFTYENAAFEGWRLCISRAGTTFTKYFPDKKFGGPRKSLTAAEDTLDQLKVILTDGKRVNGKLSPAVIKKSEALLSKL